jgi:hypothetical protein
VCAFKRKLVLGFSVMCFLVCSFQKKKRKMCVEFGLVAPDVYNGLTIIIKNCNFQIIIFNNERNLYSLIYYYNDIKYIFYYFNFNLLKYYIKF